MLNKLEKYLLEIINRRILNEDGDNGEDVDIPDINPSTPEIPAPSTPVPTEPTPNTITPQPPTAKSSEPEKDTTKVNKKPVTGELWPVITKDEAKRFIQKETRGRIFTVSFLKKTDGQMRIMQGRLGVRKYLKGGTLPYNPADYNLIPCFDVRIKAYRMISVDNLISLTFNKKTYLIQENLDGGSLKVDDKVLKEVKIVTNKLKVTHNNHGIISFKVFNTKSFTGRITPEGVSSVVLRAEEFGRVLTQQDIPYKRSHDEGVARFIIPLSCFDFSNAKINEVKIINKKIPLTLKSNLVTYFNLDNKDYPVARPAVGKYNYIRSIDKELVDYIKANNIPYEIYLGNLKILSFYFDITQNDNITEVKIVNRIKATFETNSNGHIKVIPTDNNWSYYGVITKGYPDDVLFVVNNRISVEEFENYLRSINIPFEINGNGSLKVFIIKIKFFEPIKKEEISEVKIVTPVVAVRLLTPIMDTILEDWEFVEGNNFEIGRITYNKKLKRLKFEFSGDLDEFGDLDVNNSKIAERFKDVFKMIIAKDDKGYKFGVGEDYIYFYLK